MTTGKLFYQWGEFSADTVWLLQVRFADSLSANDSLLLKDHVLVNGWKWNVTVWSIMMKVR